MNHMHKWQALWQVLHPHILICPISISATPTNQLQISKKELLVKQGSLYLSIISIDMV